MPKKSAINRKYNSRPLPDSEHAISFTLPSWKDVVAYQEDRKNTDADSSDEGTCLFLPAHTQNLFDEYARKFAKENECTFVFPTKKVALRAQRFVQEKTSQKGRIHNLTGTDIHVVCFPEEHFAIARRFWMYSGDIISSRMAKAILEGKLEVRDEEKKAEKVAKRKIREIIANITGERPQNVALFPTGKSAISTVHRFLQISFPDRKSVQFGYPHRDCLKVQEEFGNGVHFFPKGDDDDLKKLEELLKKEKVLGIFCELPGNPTTKNIDLKKLKILAKRYTVPFIFDDTIGTFQNVKAFSIADIVISSLSRFFSGAGDTQGGALIVHTSSRFGQMFARVFKGNYEDLLWREDAMRLEKNAQDFAKRTEKANESAEKLCNFLTNHPAIYKVFSPKFGPNSLQENEVEFGGVFSFLLYNPPVNTPLFYDAFALKKGPTFGNNFTVLCPYTQTTLFDDLDMAAKYGISPYLLQVSVGLEDPDMLIEEFTKALSKTQS